MAMASPTDCHRVVEGRIGALVPSSEMRRRAGFWCSELIDRGFERSRRARNVIFGARRVVLATAELLAAILVIGKRWLGS